ncbi:hypothetical protein ANO11243_030370 [Dothideomycetidae sp. 11243]|nr:hypothetical protein ANO11243_030370 [fungal sp. No.11243]
MAPTDDTATKLRADAVLAMQEPYMQQIASGEKTYEFRKRRLADSVKRIWFYRTAPYSSIEYVCEIEPARTRNEGDPPLPEDGLGNHEYNTGHQDWEGRQATGGHKPRGAREKQKQRHLRSSGEGLRSRSSAAVAGVRHLAKPCPPPGANATGSGGFGGPWTPELDAVTSWLFPSDKTASSGNN